MDRFRLRRLARSAYRVVLLLSGFTLPFRLRTRLILEGTTPPAPWPHSARGARPTRGTRSKSLARLATRLDLDWSPVVLKRSPSLCVLRAARVKRVRPLLTPPDRQLLNDAHLLLVIIRATGSNSLTGSPSDQEQGFNC